ncbi:hypothetical protein GCM10018793_61150 [Streptomyces sulfonofaciens]|uniref:Uncharacterized protein n=1 Tax=Streptomyces sulfonofaciens TaxID=68272 RepID=A0A919GLT5_9ACTN|nr:hypothetical protein GCM10018793_61150 [Streptomyces sulfonofaciens]
MGASTTGGQTVYGPIARPPDSGARESSVAAGASVAATAGAAGGAVVVMGVDIPPLSRTGKRALKVVS